MSWRAMQHTTNNAILTAAPGTKARGAGGQAMREVARTLGPEAADAEVLTRMAPATTMTNNNNKQQTAMMIRIV